MNRKIDEALNSLDNISRASPRPFFFTRLEAMMLGERSNWNRLSVFFARPAFALACAFIVVVMNIAVIFSNRDVSQDSTAPGNTEVAVADEYSYVTTNFFELEK